MFSSAEEKVLWATSRAVSAALRAAPRKVSSARRACSRLYSAPSRICAGTSKLVCLASVMIDLRSAVSAAAAGWVARIEGPAAPQRRNADCRGKDRMTDWLTLKLSPDSLAWR